MKDCLHRSLTCTGGYGNAIPGSEWECLTCGVKMSVEEVRELFSLREFGEGAEMQRELFYEHEDDFIEVRGAMGQL